MLTIAYLANQFPSAVEPYVWEEIEELRQRGLRIVTGSVRKPGAANSQLGSCTLDVVLQPVRIFILLRAAVLCVRRWKRISSIINRVLLHGSEGPIQRMKALLHTWLGACYALMLQNRGVDHIHVHHGYFGSWIAMIAARLLGVDFSMTLHGSDMLLHGAYLDVKLENCKFCLTVSEFNRLYILEHYPDVEGKKVMVSRLGVEVGKCSSAGETVPCRSEIALLAVGRLHAVKDHAFLVRACAELEASGVEFECFIAGEGPERRKLESLIRKCGLENRVTLLGHVAREQMDSLYERADVVVLTSRSEGIPLVLMEAMARGKIVLAPAITGIPELVTAGKNGFLYEAGSLDDFVAQVLLIRSLIQVRDRLSPHVLLASKRLDWIRHAARVEVRHKFNRRKNLELFGDLFISWITPQTGILPHENFVLQQIQLSVQRDRSVLVRVDEADAIAGTRDSVVLDG
jgi:colanic acid/amylovoran biosynthesis glycosyltransferase